jgi:hypothetical protein
MSPVKLAIGSCAVTIAESETITSFKGGGLTAAFHEERTGQAATASSIGAPSVRDMNRTHDLAHAMLANAMGFPYSPTLRALATYGERYRYWREEEAAVLAFQTWAFAAGIDLVEVAKVQFGKVE